MKRSIWGILGFNGCLLIVFVVIVALSLVAKRVIETPFDDGISVKMLLQPYKKQINNK